MAELLQKIPAVKRWSITAKILTRHLVVMTKKTSVPIMGKGEGIIELVDGWKKWREITGRIYSAVGTMSYPEIKETFNVPVNDAIDAAKLYILARTLLAGPEMEPEIIEAKPERAVVRWTKCTWWERYIEHEVDPGLTVCDAGHQAFTEEGLRVINPKLTYKLTKTLPKGDPYCESIIEFKEG